MNEFQKFCQEIQWAVIAAANGEIIQYQDRSGVWLDKPLSGFVHGRKYRVKPKTIIIAGHEVTAPSRDPLLFKQKYFLPNTSLERGYSEAYWCGEPRHIRFLQQGLVHLTKEAAQEHAKALVSLTTE